MALILNLETATTNCSVSIGQDGKCIAQKEFNGKGFTHAENLHVFIEEVIKMASVSLEQIDAIAVSMGPGSYTGLRIGVSAAKGLCFALNKPLIALPTLEILARSIQVDNGHILPLIDARRMEVYSAVFDAHYETKRETRAEILESGLYDEWMKDQPLHILGSGAEKAKEMIVHDKAVFHASKEVPSATDMCLPAELKWQKNELEDVAYFEPYYLKDFVVTKPKKKV
ncbi:tRNA (adenosine(37)-N6)-threonylcarbamoyltransferase complex dimerization subunit type 1 TsaB [Robertkochia aurantiaca]|uniref:tRNA (adenosine(37)-N6)-threonylcarbamoyltransferase complex dimerization subunit type 1 TsaB n=1 Tax=Robertkochia aurantiaca TaxID=2873700 RepID=UPI001CC9759C|nr:tRNA (adenosine(37)-N6)-threonylcarbamoyltransferase complex dimerization subunit type 1 TsaB [Robertkochia sp. 3YJGBD-33]